MRNLPNSYAGVTKLCVCSALILFLSISAIAQKQVSGVVREGNTPLNGATVEVAGTTTATKTDASGAFSITLPSGRNTLRISFADFITQQLDVNNIADLANAEISLVRQNASLNEVVVTGYSSQRKKDITGSVSVVNVNNLKVVPSGTTEALLQGQASGVTVVNSGAPGGGSNLRIRGITSIGSTDPLVIIDGTPGSLHDLNVNDIESMQVLKDAGAASIYGVRGSNGVIIVTTKKGRAGKARVTYDGYYGTQIPDKDGFNMANTMETAIATQQSYINSNQTPAHKQFGTGATPVIPDYITPTASFEGDPDTDPSTYELYENQITRANKQGTDWFHEVFKNAPIQSHNISVSSGTDKSTFFFSVGYFNQEGTLIETYLKRYSARINTTFNVNNKIRIGQNAYIFYKKNPGFNNQNEGNGISMSYRESPIIPIYDIRGNYAGTLSEGLGNPQNPVANMRRTSNNKGNNWQVLGNVFAEVDLFKNITVRTSFGGTIDNYYYNSFGFTAYENAENNKNPNNFQEVSGFNSSWTWTNTLAFNKTIGSHSIKFVGGTEAIENYSRAIQGFKSSYFITNPSDLTVNPNLWTLNFGPPAGQTTTNFNRFGTAGPPVASTLFSLFGRADYAFQDKYLLSATVRRDGSSLFYKDNRYSVFPSFTLGWRLSNEDFMKDVSWIQDLKLRGGWGKLGSLSSVDPTNAFNLFNAQAANSYYDITGSNNGSAAATLGIYASQIGNRETTWEEDIITNIGFDASLFRKIDFSFEWYKKKIKDLLFQPLSDITVVGGATAPYLNSGNIENKGIDASITYHLTPANRDLKFDITANFTSYNNKVVSLPAGIKYYDRGSSGSGRLGAFSRLQPGEALGAFFGYDQIGLFRDDADVAASPTQAGAAPGRMKFRDVNGDKVINVDDRTFFGNPNPDFTAGMNISGTYKNFDVALFMYASVGADVVNYIRFWTDFPQVWDAAISKDAVYNSWTPDNLNARVPRLERGASFSTTDNFSSYYMENGTFLKCKSLIIGYTIPLSSIKRFGVEKLRVYAQAVNLFQATKYTGIDPELTGSDLGDNTNFGIDFGNYPANQRGFNFGINLSF